MYNIIEKERRKKMKRRIRFTPCKLSLYVLHTFLPLIAASAFLSLLHLVTASPEDMLTTAKITFASLEHILMSLCITASSCALCEWGNKQQ